jgi:hypothetical protein
MDADLCLIILADCAEARGQIVQILEDYRLSTDIHQPRYVLHIKRW